ncbi:MAG: alanine racemase [Thermoleophilia bacterium]|nr:alanine racemase [Thermoleophilia bacterium]
MAELLVELESIRQNTAAVKKLLDRHGLALTAVTKGCLAEPAVARAMLAGGATALADTRDLSLRRLRQSFPEMEIQRIHLPSVTSPFEPGDVTFVSSVSSARAVAASAVAGRRRVMLQVETGDLREGVALEDLPDLAAAVLADERLELAGVATNFACFQDERVPELRARPRTGHRIARRGCGGQAFVLKRALRASVEAVARATRLLLERGIPVPRVSGGNSSVLALLRGGESLPAEVTELRCGEALLLGQDALVYRPLAGCRQDACRLRAEVLEEYTKSLRGRRERRLVLDLGSQDLGTGAVRFVGQGLFDAGRSSDYLVMAVEADGPRLEVGDRVEMIPSYAALVAAWTSPFVEVCCV